MKESWAPSSWKAFRYMQHVDYPSDIELANTLRLLNSLPPLVTTSEIIDLKSKLQQAALGKQFLLQGGDCAESFRSCQSQPIENKVRLLTQMSLILSASFNKPAFTVGRIAGQFAKPRSVLTETQDGKTLPSYRGDLINSIKFCEKSRQPNPLRMLDGYHFSAITLNYIRGLLSEKYPYLNQLLVDDLKQSILTYPTYQQKCQSIINTLQLLNSLCQNLNNAFNNHCFFTSHEAMHLPYEAALTRNIDGKWFNQATHYPWVGYRTAQLDSAHIEYLRGISNPVAVKLGPNASSEYVIKLLERLNPENELGKVTLVTRFGVKHITSLLPKLIQAVKLANKQVLWICDPMHGNTTMANNGYKTRHYNDVFRELKLAFEIHQAANSILGGVHLELTGEPVTECLGGWDEIHTQHLSKCYQTLVDPRLNKNQALQLAFEFAESIHQTSTNYSTLSA